jgi:toxin ParE1/3/4
MRVVWTDEALHRLLEIRAFIPSDSTPNASRFIRQLVKRTVKILKSPLIGRMVPELSSPQIRELLFGNYRIVYRITPHCIEILTVFEGHLLLSIGKDWQSE